MSVGDTVVWENEDDVEHTVTKVAGPGEDFDSQRVPPEYGTFQRDFPEPGTIEYRCEIHPDQMQARVVVQER